jgi:hypothetical protein
MSVTPIRDRILTTTRLSDGSMLVDLCALHPYVEADIAFERGHITRLQAVGMIMKDRDFIAECELQGGDKRAMAEAIVEHEWLPKQVAYLQAAKRGSA